ncbi:hypothetical protein LJ707_14555 [Mucilaginibacter sp. UR6-1]|uniref:hypothetical protein n=1 Tax=Mucilaginibacter sp. UR6-1 TaxID=1435643 RepID=UPI001E54E80A|nr:hypothetical protein [Mucilaginibacter sp. UR6-1]MCC8410158.1 hypothetical protein [Mucilaginibacter sp. UR6-1]
MKRIIFITVILLVACGYITVAYFKNLNPPGQHTSQVMRSIPANAAMVFEFPNDKSFYDIFKNNKLLAAISGKDNIDDLDTLRKILNPENNGEGLFNGQHLFISVHPADTGTALLITAVAPKNFNNKAFDLLKANKQLLISPYTVGKRKGYAIYIKPIKRRFYIINKGRGIYTGSFSNNLIQAAAGNEAEKTDYAISPTQQNNNSLANLYINYQQFNPLLKSYFTNDNSLPASVYGLAATGILSLNYKSDALMFNGTSSLTQGGRHGYLNVFINQKPVDNHLKNILPSTTAYYNGFALSNTKQFFTDLDKWQQNTGISKKESSLYANIKNETGVNIKQAFNLLAGNEFAVVTTRFQEKLAIVALKDGSKLLPHFLNISSGMSENSGKLNYDRLMYYLLGDAFGGFRKPYFMVIDNYLILAATYQEIQSYYESYMNRKFLTKTDGYSNFDNLMSQRGNICYFVHSKNARYVFRRGMRKQTYRSFNESEPGWQNVFGVSYQLTAAGNSFYTNFCIGANAKKDEDETLTVN